MKRLFIKILALILIVSSLALIACNGTTSANKRQIVFRISGSADEVFYVDKGEDFDTLQIPVIDKVGYDGVWTIDGVEIDERDFKNITDNVLVIARLTAKTYELTFQGGQLQGDSHLDWQSVNDFNDTVTFDGNVSLPTPSCDGYIFKHWAYGENNVKILSSGKYTVAENLVLTAVWQKDYGSDRWHSGEYQ